MTCIYISGIKLSNTKRDTRQYQGCVSVTMCSIISSDVFQFSIWLLSRALISSPFFSCDRKRVCFQFFRLFFNVQLVCTRRSSYTETPNGFVFFTVSYPELDPTLSSLEGYLNTQQQLIPAKSPQARSFHEKQPLHDFAPIAGKYTRTHSE